MARIFEAFRFEIDEVSIDTWKRGMKNSQSFREYEALKHIMAFLATEEFKTPYKVEVINDIALWRTYVDVYFEFENEQERFKFRLAGKGEELQEKIKQRIMNNEYLRPLKVSESFGT